MPEHKDVGAIWVRESKKGEKYLSIKLGDAQYVAFKNKYKEKDNQPGWRIFPSEPRDGGQQEKVEKVFQDDVPFDDKDVLF